MTALQQSNLLSVTPSMTRCILARQRTFSRSDVYLHGIALHHCRMHTRAIQTAFREARFIVMAVPPTQRALRLAHIEKPRT